jgi:hypothetical protein
VTPPEAPNDQQIGDVENYKASEKKFKTAERRSFSSPAISRMFQILQKCTLARAIFLEKEKIAGASKR